MRAALDYLAERPHRKVDCQSAQGILKFKADAEEARILMYRGMASPEINRHGYLKTISLLVPAMVARSAIRSTARVDLPARSITKPKTSVMRWRPHYDQARPAYGVRA